MYIYKQTSGVPIKWWDFEANLWKTIWTYVCVDKNEANLLCEFMAKYTNEHHYNNSKKRASLYACSFNIYLLTCWFYFKGNNKKYKKVNKLIKTNKKGKSKKKCKNKLDQKPFQQIISRGKRKMLWSIKTLHLHLPINSTYSHKLFS